MSTKILRVKLQDRLDLQSSTHYLALLSIHVFIPGTQYQSHGTGTLSSWLGVGNAPTLEVCITFPLPNL